MASFTKKISEFLKTDIWRIPSESLSGFKQFGVNFVRTLVLALRGFSEDKCHLMASALTYLSILSVVPLAALGFGIAKGFGFEKVLEEQVYDRLHGHEEVAERIIEFSSSLLEHARGDMIAGIGFILLLWTIIMMLGNIEISFNNIWGVKKNRKFARKFSDYLSVAIISLLLFISSSIINVFISAWAAREGAGGSIISPLIKTLPYLFIWAMFSFVYIFMPNTKVRLKSGLLAGFVAGTAYQVVQILYIRLQVYLTGYGAIYGSFAALPLFLIWMRISWIATLFGAEISFAHQNVRTYEFEADCQHISYRLKKTLMLKTARLAIKNFTGAGNPVSAEDVSANLEIPIRLSRILLYELAESGLLCELKDDDGKTASYQPGIDISSLTIADVINKIEKTGLERAAFAGASADDKISRALEDFDSQIKSSPSNTRIKDM